MEESLQQKSYDWVVNAISSSNNPFHVECCQKLIELYIAKFPDTLKEGHLLLMLHDKANTINYF